MSIEIKIVIIGDFCVGKSAFLKRILTGDYEKRYIPTIGAEVYKISFWTNRGNIDFCVWVMAGQDKLSFLSEKYYAGAQGGMIMFDVTSKMTYKDVDKWYRDLIRVCENIPIVLIGNKVDVKDRKVDTEMISCHRRYNMQYFEVSVKYKFQIEKPFLWVCRKILGDPFLSFISQVDGNDFGVQRCFGGIRDMNFFNFQNGIDREQEIMKR
ncbi:hypothetical protein SteCoe_8808 [Stentor coeruleus]|uniref:GTP-binding nuclear protein n=1 Tax=Stentor coeruleus TaxID=5963 RepID=A0A1R2CJA7_9CILI|nr:hypothetical protein SteCoe_8808 [Stentor coeruleus]